MAALPITVCTGALALTGSNSVLTLQQLTAPTNQKVKVREVSISFQGTSNTASPVLCDVVQQNNTGASMVTNSPTLWDTDLQETVQTTGKSLNTSGQTEPGSPVVIWQEYVHPQTGLLWQAPFGGDFIIKGGGHLGIRANANAAVNVVCRAICEE